MENDELESAQIKEVYARFGLAIFHVQGFERQLAIVLASKYGPGPRKLSRGQFDELLESLFGRTLGYLMTELKQVAKVPDWMEGDLREALSKRNWLVHHYFWGKALQFLNPNPPKDVLGDSP